MAKDLLNKKDYLNSVANNYNDYSRKGLKFRAKPFLYAKLPSSPKRILVVGLALGGPEEIEAINRFFPDYNVYGVDIVKNTLNQNLKAKLFHCDLLDLQFKNNFFAAVMCSSVLHEVYSFSKNNINDISIAISEISRVLAPKGIAAIREYFVQKKEYAHLICLTKDSKNFAKKFIRNFRNTFDPKIKKQFEMKNGIIYSNSVLLNELILHFRISKLYFKSFKDFFNSKEIEEQYLPLSVQNYAHLFESNYLELININRINLPKYYNLIEENFKLLDPKNNQIKNKFGFMDLIVRKKENQNP